MRIQSTCYLVPQCFPKISAHRASEVSVFLQWGESGCFSMSFLKFGGPCGIRFSRPFAEVFFPTMPPPPPFSEKSGYYQLLKEVPVQVMPGIFQEFEREPLSKFPKRLLPQGM